MGQHDELYLSDSGRPVFSLGICVGYIHSIYGAQCPVFDTEMAVGHVTGLLCVESGVWQDYHTGGQY